MDIQIFSDEYSIDVETKQLIEVINSTFKDMEGTIFYKFPPVKEFDKMPVSPDIFIVTKAWGVVSIIVDTMNVSRENDMETFVEKLEIIDNYIFTSLLKNKELKLNNRNLKFDILTIGYCPNLTKNDTDEQRIFCNKKSILDILKNINDFKMTDELVKEIVATLEASAAIIKPKERLLQDNESDTKAHLLKEIETRIARFDDEQRLSALSLYNGPQRIRGLAGSGKTIILCLKAANLHLNYPDKMILYTFYTRSLYDYIVQLISRFYMKMTDGQLPDFEKIRVLHAWGGKQVPGVYSEACFDNDLKPLTFAQVGRNKPFATVCEDFINRTQYRAKKKYDYILLDEAQDYDVSFYQLCRSIVRDDHLIWCYDEVQNIFEVELQNTQKTFSNKFDSKGIDLIEEQKRHPEMPNDIVLHKSYRNIKEILVVAVAIGFGIYNDKLIQSLENNKHWEDLGFKVVHGDCSKEEDVVIEGRKEGI